MAHCEDCGTKMDKGFCPNCDEEHFISDQYRDLGMGVPETIFDAECLERWSGACVEEMMHTARAYGYALAVHGSMKFDIDIVCVPWIKEADSPESLVSALREACTQVTHLPTYLGRFTLPSHWEFENDENKDCPVSVDRPHRRRSWAWQLGGGAYVDCSVMLRTED